MKKEITLENLENDSSITSEDIFPNKADFNVTSELMSMLGTTPDKEFDLSNVKPPEGVTEEQAARAKAPFTDNKLYSYGELVKMLEEHGENEKIPTGFEPIDTIVDGGFEPGELIVLSGPTKHGKSLRLGTKVLMHDGSIKNIENVVVGDKLMGDDSTPRNVLALGGGKEMMYRVTLRNGDCFDCNESHILSLRRTGTNKMKRSKPIKSRKGEIVNINLVDYLDKSKSFKHIYKAYKVGVEFKKRTLAIDPYFLGVWLGDGTKSLTQITTTDKEILDYLKYYAETIGQRVSVFTDKRSDVILRCNIVGEKHGHNKLLTLMRKINVIGNKHIPKDFLINSRENRLKLLAGLIDSDGNVMGKYNIEFLNKNKKICSDMVFLARSLGFSANMKERICTGFGITGIYYRVILGGRLQEIPLLVRRKMPIGADKPKECLNYSFTVEKLEVDNYYGVVIDKNKLFLLADYTVVHNTSFAQTTSYLQGNLGFPSLWFTLEMSWQELVKKFMEMDKSSSPKLMTSDLPIFMPIDNTALSLGWMEERIIEAQKHSLVSCVYIDHLHFLLPLKDFNQNVSFLVGGIVREIKKMATKLRVPIVLISHTKKLDVNEDPDINSLRDCLPGSALVYSNGNRIRVDKLKAGMPVLSKKSLASLQKDTVKAVWPTGKKKMLEIKTKTGRRLVCSTGHRLFAATYKKTNKFGPGQGCGIAGWTKACDLSVNQKVAVPANYLEPEVKETMSVESATLLGWIVGDGYVRPNVGSGHTEVTINTKKEVDLFCKLAKKAWDIRPRYLAYKDKKAYRLYLTNNGHKNCYLDFIRSTKYNGVSYKKYVPEIVFNQPNKIVAGFLSGLFHADGNSSFSGYGSDKKSIAIRLDTISEKLAYEVSHLLLRFGIVSHIVKKSTEGSGYKASVDFSYVVIVRNRDADRFLEKIGFLGEKQIKLKKMMLSWGYSKNKKRRDIIFDRITSIKDVGEQDTYDVSVVGNHKSVDNNSFCVDDFITHNSSFIAQESDFTFMIWRQRNIEKNRKKKDEDAPVDEERNVYKDWSWLSLEANRRNGITKKIPMGFLNGRFYPYKEYEEITSIHDINEFKSNRAYNSGA